MLVGRYEKAVYAIDDWTLCAMVVVSLTAVASSISCANDAFIIVATVEFVHSSCSSFLEASVPCGNWDYRSNRRACHIRTLFCCNCNIVVAVLLFVRVPAANSASNLCADVLVIPNVLHCTGSNNCCSKDYGKKVRDLSLHGRQISLLLQGPPLNFCLLDIPCWSSAWLHAMM